MKKILSSIIFAAFLTLAFAQSASAVTSALGSTYKCKELKWSIKVPKGWKTDESTPGQILFYEPHPTEGQTGASIIVIPTTSTEKFDKEIANSKTELLGIPGYSIWKDKAFKVKNAKAHLLGGLMPVDANISVRNLQLIVAKGTKFYVITATAADSTWKSYSKLFDKVLKTFKP